MKKKLIELISNLESFLNFLKAKLLSNEDIEEDIYSALSPISDADKGRDYVKALNWALKNRKDKDIKNIALTGPYGSGKSSILKTFQKNYHDNDLKFLNISLATFKEENEALPHAANLDTVELLRQIEISILQQIFYHEEDRKIPDSRFKKIKSYSRLELVLTGLGYLLFFIAIYNFIEPKFLVKVFKNLTFDIESLNVIHYISIVIILTGIFYLIYKSVRVLNSLTINKLTIQNAEIGVGDNLNKSILNHHLDEILYFFSKRPYNVVIIEDLDRFKQTEIFTKLREINLLLNNSEKTKKKNIVFIYAVRDEMFTDKERTKFFDFIIPVIPTINSSNSNEILLHKNKENKYGLTESFIENISFIIDDMRLLHNICNEYIIYKNKLSSDLISNKLFSIIVYKNILPNDFVSLSENSGILYEMLISKKDYIQTINSKIDEDIKLLKEEISELEKTFFSNIKDLRKLYILEYIQQLPRFKSFVINDSEVLVNDVIKDENFDYVLNNEIKYNKFSNYEPLFTQVDFKTIEQNVNADKTYKQIEKNIENNNNDKVNLNYKKIKELEIKKDLNRSKKVSELMDADINFKDILNNEALKNPFLFTFIRNGYIAEDYIDYISIFHEGSLTRIDYSFYINIQNRLNQEFDYKLNKKLKLIERISLSDFNSEYVLNYDLLDTLLDNNKEFPDKLNALFDKLVDESEKSVLFILGCYENISHIDVFTKLLARRWKNLWTFLANNNVDPDKLNMIFRNIILHVDIEVMKNISQKNNFRQKIYTDNNFLNFLENTDRIKEIVEGLSIKFENIDFKNSPQELAYFIYENSYYEINIYNLINIMEYFGNFNQVDFDHSNYFCVLNSECDYLIDHIKDYITTYIMDVYLLIDTNKNEDINSYLELLNNDDLDNEMIGHVINKVDTKIQNLNEINDNEVSKLLTISNKIEETWANLLSLKNKEVDTSILINYLNDVENAEKLSKIRISNSMSEYKNFVLELIYLEAIENDSYALILKSFPWWYNDLRLEEISHEKVRSLIMNNIIRPAIESFDKIRETHKDLLLTLIERQKSKYLEIIDNLNIDTEDLSNILNSNVIDDSMKNKFYQKILATELFDKNSIIKSLIRIKANNDSFEISDVILKKLLLNKNTEYLDKLKVFNKYYNILSQTDIPEFLNNLPAPYNEIARIDRRALIPITPVNEMFLENLQKLNFISSFKNEKSGFRIYHKLKN